MSAFLDQLLLRSLSKEELAAAGSPETQLYELMADFAYESDKLGYTVVCKAGMITDEASVPQCVQSLLPSDHPHIAWPAIPHDYVFKLQGKMPDGRVISFEEANAMLREAMELQGSPIWQREAVYEILMKFGRASWDSPTIYSLS